MTENLWIKIGTKGKRGKAKKIICSNCGKELLVRIQQKHSGLCRSCNLKKPKIKEGEIYIEWKGIRYRARKVICKDCGKEILVPKNRDHQGYCSICNAKKLGEKSKLRDGELFIVRKDGEKNRANKHKCSKCAKEWLVRNDTVLKTSLCKECTLSENGVKTGKRSAEWNTTFSRNLYRKIAFKYFKEECSLCGNKKRIQIHHIDCDNKNNDISNLIPLCCSCHRSVHWRIRKGSTHDEAIAIIKQKRLQKIENH